MPRFWQIVTARGKVGLGISRLSPLSHKTLMARNIEVWQPKDMNTSSTVKGASAVEYLI